MDSLNIICNNCVGGSIYRKLQIPYSNPFIWIGMNREDFIYLINHYDEIDFSKRKIIKTDFFRIIIDDKISMRFSHHIEDPNYDIPTRKEYGNIYYKDMMNYILDCYDKRLKRMKKDPIFIISDKKTQPENHNFFAGDYLKNINTKYRVIYCGAEDPKIDNIEFVKCDEQDVKKIASIIVSKIDLK